MYTGSFTNRFNSDRMDSFQIQYLAEEYFDNHTSEDNIMATLKKEPTKAPAPAAKAPASSTKPEAKKEPKKAAGPKGGPRAVPEGYVGLEALATEFDTTTVAIRRKLRNSEIAKPEGSGWVFKDNSKDLAAVRKLLAAPEPKAAAPAKDAKKAA